MKKKLKGLSFNWCECFVRNLIIVVGVIGIWRGMWDMMDRYLFPDFPVLSDVVSIIAGLALLYLPDGSWHQMGDYSPSKKK